MKTPLTIFLTLLLLISCKKQSNSLSVVLSRSEPTDSTEILPTHLIIKNKDSIYFRARPLIILGPNDLKFNNLPDGEYQIKYEDIIGNLITKKFALEKDSKKEIRIIFDSINAEKFYTKIPFNNLQNGQSYKIEGKDGCIATMYYGYQISKKNSSYYFKSLNSDEIALNKAQINAIKKFEAELLAIENKNICSSTGRMTYTILTKEASHSITDNTCNWNGWKNMMQKIYKQ